MSQTSPQGDPNLMRALDEAVLRRNEELDALESELDRLESDSDAATSSEIERLMDVHAAEMSRTKSSSRAQGHRANERFSQNQEETRLRLGRIEERQRGIEERTDVLLQQLRHLNDKIDLGFSHLIDRGPNSHSRTDHPSLFSRPRRQVIRLCAMAAATVILAAVWHFAT